MQITVQSSPVSKEREVDYRAELSGECDTPGHVEHEPAH